MIVKTSFSGRSMRKYFIAGLLLKLALIAVFIFDVIIPFGSEFLKLLQESLNSGVWNLLELLVPIGKILLYGVGLVVVEIVVVFLIIMPLAGRELKSRRW